MRSAFLSGFFLALCFVLPSHAQTESTSGKVFWRGEVDNKVQLTIRNLSLEQRTVEGSPKPDGNFSFTAALPQVPVKVDVNRKEGRSKAITVLQQPSSENNYTAIIEIYDDDGGADDYLLEIFWQVG